MKGLAHVFPLLLAVLVTLLPLPVAPLKASPAEGGATMAAPAVFVLEQPARQVLPPFTSRKAVALVALMLALLLLEQPQVRGRVLGRAFAPPQKPALAIFGKLQLEGG